jgi:hypothetical protein
MTAVTTILPPPFLKLLFAPSTAAPIVSATREESADIQVSGQIG